jgi:hypothetical protein
MPFDAMTINKTQFQPFEGGEITTCVFTWGELPFVCRMRWIKPDNGELKLIEVREFGKPSPERLKAYTQTLLTSF